jgi:L-fuconolactonase
MSLWSNERLQEWLAKYPEEPILPHLPLIDAHHHVFQRPQKLPSVTTPSREDVLSRTFGRAPLIGGYTHEDWTRDAKGTNVLGTVYVEAKVAYDRSHTFPEVGETAWALSVFKAANNGFCRGVIAALDLTNDDEGIEERLRAHRVVLQGELCRLSGIRHQLAHFPGLLSPAPAGQWLNCIRGARLVGSLGLPVDIWLYSNQILDLVELARACPQTTFVCDHFGGPTGADETTFSSWLKALHLLSALGNVVMKAGKIFCDISKR